MFEINIYILVILWFQITDILILTDTLQYLDRKSIKCSTSFHLIYSNLTCKYTWNVTFGFNRGTLSISANIGT